MNSEMHEKIATEAFESLPNKIKDKWTGLHEALKITCEYPDIFADRQMSQEDKKKIDPDADMFIEPDKSQDKWCKYVMEKCIQRFAVGSISSAIIEDSFYLLEHYVNKTYQYLVTGDFWNAGKFAGVFSHIIADLAQPIHLLNPSVIDILLPPPKDFIGFELHHNIERISGRIKIDNNPKILGGNVKRAIMGLYQSMSAMIDECRCTTLPIVDAVYSQNTERIASLVSISVSLAARELANFLFTVWTLTDKENVTGEMGGGLDLCYYPYFFSNIDMIYRYRPMVDCSLVPFSGGKTYPLCLVDKKGHIKEIHGLGIIPWMGLLVTLEKKYEYREASIEYLLVPGAYKNFRSEVGLNPKFKDTDGSVILQIFVDNKEVARTLEMVTGDKSVILDVELPENARILKLSMLTVKEPSLPAWKKHPHGVWGTPELC